MKLSIKTSVALFLTATFFSANAQTEYRFENVEISIPVIPGICTAALLTGLKTFDAHLASLHPEKQYSKLGNIPAVLCAGGVVILVKEIISVLKANPDYKFTKKAAVKVILALATVGLIPLYFSKTSATGDLVTTTTKNLAEGIVNNTCSFADILVRNITGA